MPSSNCRWGHERDFIIQIGQLLNPSLDGGANLEIFVAPSAPQKKPYVQNFSLFNLIFDYDFLAALSTL